MERIKKWMDKNGIAYQERTFGNSYFHSVSIAFDGITVTLGRNSYNDYEKIRKYAGRYGYIITRLCGYPGVTYFDVMRAEDHAALDNLLTYTREAQNACNEEIHLRRQGFFSRETDSQFNERLKGIMEYYEEEYKKHTAA